MTSVPSNARSAGESCWNMMSWMRARSGRGMGGMYGLDALAVGSQTPRS
jgi:hypothetical protein